MERVRVAQRRIEELEEALLRRSARVAELEVELRVERSARKLIHDLQVVTAKDRDRALSERDAVLTRMLTRRDPC